MSFQEIFQGFKILKVIFKYLNDSYMIDVLGQFF